jgi:hypothetical protein
LLQVRSHHRAPKADWSLCKRLFFGPKVGLFEFGDLVGDPLVRQEMAGNYQICAPTGFKPVRNLFDGQTAICTRLN